MEGGSSTSGSTCLEGTLPTAAPPALPSALLLLLLLLRVASEETRQGDPMQDSCCTVSDWEPCAAC